MNVSKYHSKINNDDSASEDGLRISTYCYWSQVNRLSNLSLHFSTSLSSVARIYGDGLNQVSVVINLKILDKKNAILNLSDYDLYNAIYLFDFNTGRKIEATSPTWIYSKVKNEYNNAISYMTFYSFGDESDIQSDTQHFDSDMKSLIFHISSIVMDDGKVFAVGIDIPNVGAFDTSRNGTQTPNGASGSVFRSPSNVTVIAEQPTNYSDQRNISMQYGVYSTLSISEYYTGRWNNTSWGGYAGIEKRKIVYLRSSAEYPFLKSSVTYSPIGNDQPSTGTVPYWNRPGMKAMGESSGLPCATIGKRMLDNQFYAFF